jgi:hypothetical protein
MWGEQFPNALKFLGVSEDSHIHEFSIKKDERRIEKWLCV